MKKTKVKKVKGIIEKILLGLFYTSFLIIFINDISDSIFSSIISTVASIVVYFSIFLYAILAPLTKTSNQILFLISTIFVAILLNYFTSFDFSDIPTMNLSLISLVYFVIFIKSLIVVKKNAFLKIMISAATFFALLYLIAIAFLLVSPFDINDKLNYFINILFILATFALIFSLPNSNYSEWKKDHRIVFVKSVLSVWILFFVMSISQVFIDDEQYLKTLIYPDFNDEWFMKDYPVGNESQIDNQN